MCMRGRLKKQTPENRQLETIVVCSSVLAVSQQGLDARAELGEGEDGAWGCTQLEGQRSSSRKHEQMWRGGESMLEDVGDLRQNCHLGLGSCSCPSAVAHVRMLSSLDNGMCCKDEL